MSARSIVEMDGNIYLLTKHGKARFHERMAKKDRKYTDEEIVKLLKDHPLAVWVSDRIRVSKQEVFRLVTVLRDGGQ